MTSMNQKNSSSFIMDSVYIIIYIYIIFVYNKYIYKMHEIKRSVNRNAEMSTMRGTTATNCKKVFEYNKSQYGAVSELSESRSSVSDVYAGFKSKKQKYYLLVNGELENARKFIGEFSPSSMKSIALTNFNSQESIKRNETELISNRFTQKTLFHSICNELELNSEPKILIFTQLQKIIKKRLYISFQSLKQLLIQPAASVQSSSHSQHPQHNNLPPQWELIQQILKLKQQNLKISAFERLIPVSTRNKYKASQLTTSISEILNKKKSQFSSQFFNAVKQQAKKKKNVAHNKKQINTPKKLQEKGINTDATSQYFNMDTYGKKKKSENSHYNNHKFDKYDKNEKFEKFEERLAKSKSQKYRIERSSQKRFSKSKIKLVLVDPTNLYLNHSPHCCLNPKKEYYNHESSQKKSTQYEQTKQERKKYLSYLKERAALEQQYLSKKASQFYIQLKNNRF